MSVPLAVIAPVFRNEPTLAALVERTMAAAPEATVVLVDDACPSRSGAEVDRLAQPGSQVVAIHHAVNLGQQAAIRTGLHCVDAEAYVVIDADLQDPPEAIPQLVSALRRSPVDAVFAGRRGHYEGVVRRLGGIMHRRVLAMAFGLPVDAGGFVALSARCVRSVLAMGGPPQLVAMVGRSGLASTSIPVTRSPRPSGRSTIDRRARLRHAVAAFAHVRRRRLPAGPPHQE